MKDKDFNFISFRLLGDKRYCLDVQGLDNETKTGIYLTLSYLVGNVVGIKRLNENIDTKFFKKEMEVSLDYCIETLGIGELK